MNNKIGILTLRPTENYGGILQAAALYKVMADFGLSPTLIQKEKKRSLLKVFATKILSYIPFQNINNHRLIRIKTKENKGFIDEYIPNRTGVLYTNNQIGECIERLNFDYIVVGSDQVWRWDYIDDGYYSVFFLNFDIPLKTKKFSYAASFGKDHWQKTKVIEDVKVYLRNFDNISTREVSGREICREVFERDDCEHVLDPTLLLQKSFYEDIASKSKLQCEGKFILSYVLDEESSARNVLNKLLGKIDYTDRVIDIKKMSLSGKVINVYDWIKLFSRAEIILTDSFHGMIFSVIFNKQFWVIGNKSRGLSRFESFLEVAGLESRLIVEENLNITEQPDIDYSIVNKNIEIKRVESINYIKKCLT